MQISNHSNRSSAVSNLTKKGVCEQEVIKMTGYSSTNSLKPYLQLDEEHHANIVNVLRRDGGTNQNLGSPVINYNNCTFNCGSVNCA